MNRLIATLIVVVVITSFALAQGQSGSSTPTSPAQASSAPAEHANSAANSMVVGAVLDKSIDARKAKEGDQVVAKITQDVKGPGGEVIKRGSKIIGHVTQVQARGKGQDSSSLAFVFDKIQAGKDQEMPFHAVLQAVAPPPQVALSSDVTPGASSAPSYGGAGNVGGNGSIPSSSGNAVGRTNETPATMGGNSDAQGPQGKGVATSTDANAQLTGNSHGAIGLKDIQLTSSDAGGTTSSMLTSTSSNVRLESGSRMVLRVSQQ